MKRALNVNTTIWSQCALSSNNAGMLFGRATVQLNALSTGTTLLPTITVIYISLRHQIKVVPKEVQQKKEKN